MAIQFSAQSRANLNTCNSALVLLANGVAKICPPELDFSIVEGHRTVEKQQEYFEKGLTKLDGVNQKSNHNYVPSRALDFYPWHPEYGSLTGHPKQVAKIAKETGKTDAEVFQWIYGKFYGVYILFLVEAARLKCKIRWGGDWDGDGSFLDHSFIDLPHIESVK